MHVETMKNAIILNQNKVTFLILMPIFQKISSSSDIDKCSNWLIGEGISLWLARSFDFCKYPWSRPCKTGWQIFMHSEAKIWY